MLLLWIYREWIIGQEKDKRKTKDFSVWGIFPLQRVQDRAAWFYIYFHACVPVTLEFLLSHDLTLVPFASNSLWVFWPHNFRFVSHYCHLFVDALAACFFNYRPFIGLLLDMFVLDYAHFLVFVFFCLPLAALSLVLFLSFFCFLLVFFVSFSCLPLVTSFCLYLI